MSLVSNIGLAEYVERRQRIDPDERAGRDLPAGPSAERAGDLFCGFSRSAAHRRTALCTNNCPDSIDARGGARAVLDLQRSGRHNHRTDRKRPRRRKARTES